MRQPSAVAPNTPSNCACGPKRDCQARPSVAVTLSNATDSQAWPCGVSRACQKAQSAPSAPITGSQPMLSASRHGLTISGLTSRMFENQSRSSSGEIASGRPMHCGKLVRKKPATIAPAPSSSAKRTARLSARMKLSPSSSAAVSSRLDR